MLHFWLTERNISLNVQYKSFHILACFVHFYSMSLVLGSSCSVCKLVTILNLVKLTETRNICTRKPCESFKETRNTCYRRTRLRIGIKFLAKLQKISLCLYVTVQFATKSFISTAISLVLAYGFHSESRCSSKADCSQADDQVNELLSKYTESCT